MTSHGVWGWICERIGFPLSTSVFHHQEYPVKSCPMSLKYVLGETFIGGTLNLRHRSMSISVTSHRSPVISQTRSPCLVASRMALIFMLKLGVLFIPVDNCHDVTISSMFIGIYCHVVTSFYSDDPLTTPQGRCDLLPLALLEIHPKISPFAP